MPRNWNPRPTVRAMYARKRVRLARAHAAARGHEIETTLAPGRPTAGIAPNKNPIRRRRTGLRFLNRSRLREGNESCVHRLGSTGGGSFCTSHCRVGSGHSLFLQEASAGRNLITLFHSVNNPRAIFSGNPAARPSADLPTNRIAAPSMTGMATAKPPSPFFKSAFF